MTRRGSCSCLRKHKGMLKMDKNATEYCFASLLLVLRCASHPEKQSVPLSFSRLLIGHSKLPNPANTIGTHT